MIQESILISGKNRGFKNKAADLLSPIGSFYKPK